MSFMCDNLREVFRMAGGIEAGVNQYPWNVRMRIDYGSPPTYCGGSIIDKKWILTGTGIRTNYEKIIKLL